MNAADAVGWIVEGTYYCDACTPSKEADNDAHPIFGDSEADGFSHCAECDELIPEALTSDGVARTLEALNAYLVRRSGRSEIVRMWAKMLRAYFAIQEEGRVVCDFVIEATKEENVQQERKDTFRTIAGLVEEAEECEECSNATCEAIRRIKKVIGS